MRGLRILATAAMAAAAASAHAEHFQYGLMLSGTYSIGGTDGCYPPDFDQPACPRAGTLTATLSFDTPSGSDGSYGVGSDITNFVVTLGSLSSDSLFGGINLTGGVPDGSVQAFDDSEKFTFDWATRSAWYSYDYGYHAANGNFSGAMFAAPEPSPAMLLLAGLAAVGMVGQRRAARSAKA